MKTIFSIIVAAVLLFTSCDTGVLDNTSMGTGNNHTTVTKEDLNFLEFKSEGVMTVSTSLTTTSSVVASVGDDLVLSDNISTLEVGANDLSADSDVTFTYNEQPGLLKVQVPDANVDNGFSVKLSVDEFSFAGNWNDIKLWEMIISGSDTTYQLVGGTYDILDHTINVNGGVHESSYSLATDE